MNKNVQVILQSYLYSGVSAAAALWMNGIRDWKTLGIAALGAVLGPIFQAVNPKDPSVGVGAKK